MTILLTEKEMLDLAYDYLDILPNPDHAHEIAKQMDMKYMELMDMYWDVEEISLRKLNRGMALHQTKTE